MNCSSFLIRPAFALLLMGFVATPAVAETENKTSFAALEAFQAQSSNPVFIEGALVVHDLRQWAQSWDYRREQLGAFDLGRAYYKTQDAEGGVFFQRELKALLELASPQLSAVPAAVVVFADQTMVPQFQALLKVGSGWRKRWEAAKDAEVFKELGVSVDDNAIRIERPNFYAVGSVDDEGWLRLSPNPNSLEGGLHAGRIFSDKMTSWVKGVEATVFIRRGMMFQTLILPFISNEHLGGLMQGFQGAALTWETGSKASSRYKFLLDVDGLQGMQPLLKKNPLSNPLVQIWDDDATDFAALSLPPPLLDLVRGIAANYLGQAIGDETELIRKSLMNISGRAGIVHFGSPKDWAFGFHFDSVEGASDFVQGIYDYGQAKLANSAKQSKEQLVMEVGATSQGKTLLIRANKALEGVRLANLGKSVVFVPQKSRLDKLRQSQVDVKKAAAIYQSILDGPILPRVREVIERPAIFTGYSVFSAPGMIWDLGKWLFGGLDGFANEVATQLNVDSLQSFVSADQSFASQFTLMELILLLTYDCGFMVDVDGSVFVAQFVVSDI